MVGAPKNRRATRPNWEIATRIIDACFVTGDA